MDSPLSSSTKFSPHIVRARDLGVFESEWAALVPWAATLPWAESSAAHLGSPQLPATSSARSSSPTMPAALIPIYSHLLLAVTSFKRGPRAFVKTSVREQS